MRSFLNPCMSSWGCATDDFTKSNLKLESNYSWSEFLTLGAGEIFFNCFWGPDHTRISVFLKLDS